MRRREFIAALGGAAAWPLAVHAQLDRRVVLMSADSESDPREQTLEASKTMKAVVIGEPSGMSMEEISKVFPRHKAVVDKFLARGDVIGIGPFADLGNMAIFKTRAAAEEFVMEDPFILEGVVKPFKIRDWKDSMLPGSYGSEPSSTGSRARRR
jgi:uncharacterized protein YciI